LQSTTKRTIYCQSIFFPKFHKFLASNYKQNKVNMQNCYAMPKYPDISTLEDEDNTLPRKFWIRLTHDLASYPRRTESSAITLWKPQSPHITNMCVYVPSNTTVILAGVLFALTYMFRPLLDRNMWLRANKTPTNITVVFDGTYTHILVSTTQRKNGICKCKNYQHIIFVPLVLRLLYAGFRVSKIFEPRTPNSLVPSPLPWDAGANGLSHAIYNSATIVLDISSNEDEDIMLPREAGVRLHKEATSYPRRTESSFRDTLKWLISHLNFLFFSFNKATTSEHIT
jgi:hypothetical protein